MPQTIISYPKVTPRIYYVGWHGEAFCIDTWSAYRGNGKAIHLESCKEEQWRVWRAVDPGWNQHASKCN